LTRGVQQRKHPDFVAQDFVNQAIVPMWNYFSCSFNHAWPSKLRKVREPLHEASEKLIHPDAGSGIFASYELKDF